MAGTRVDLPVVDGSLNPRNPLGTIKVLVMLLIGFTIVAWTALVGLRKGVPLMDRLVSMIPGVGNRLQSGNQSTEVF